MSSATAPAPWLQRIGNQLGRESLAWAMLVLSVLLTLVLWLSSMADYAARSRDRFQHLAEVQRTVLLDRLGDYLQVLHGTAGLFAASESVERKEWHDYVASLHLEGYLPAIQGTGFALMLPAADRAAHEAAVRAEGFPNYSIRTSGERETLSTILYIEPFSGSNLRAFGYDMYAEPVRREAMERARDSGEPALSGKVVLVQEGEGGRQPGFLAYLPIYRNGMPVATVEERRAALFGFVYSPFRAYDLMHGTFKDTTSAGEVEVFDGDPVAGNLLYASEPTPRQARHTMDKEVNIAGHRWTLRVHSGLDFEHSTASKLPTMLLIGGLALDLLLFSLLYMHARHHRRAELAAADLKSSRDRFQTLVENLPGAVFRCEPEPPWRALHISRGIESLSGQPPERYLSGECMLGQLVRPSEMAEVRATVAGAVARRESYEFELLIDEQRDLWISARGRASYDEAGRPLWIDGMLIDISAQKRAEAQLRASSAYARSLIEVSLDPLVTISADGKITDVNHATEQFTGRSRSVLVGSDFSDYFTDPQQARAVYQQVFSSGQVTDYPLTIRHLSGRLTEVRYNASVYRDEAGRVAGVFAAARDVTRLNAIAAELERHRHHLEELVGQRTRELALAKRAAEAANEAKSAFLSNMSHELRTPMNAILGMAYMIRDAGLAPRKQEYLDQLLSAGRHLLALIDDILSYVRLDTGTVSVERQAFELDGLLEACLGRVRDKAVAKGLGLFAEVGAEVPRHLAGDAVQIGQVLHKLADNAVKFTEAGAVRLVVTVLERSEGEVVLRFEVRDTGIGLSADARDAVFQSFQQADNSLTRKYGGTGLGLAIARRLVELMGGQIGVESEPGQGSCFWFTVRVGLGAAPARQSDAASSVPAVDAAPVAPQGPDATQPAVAPEFDEQRWRTLRERLVRLLREDDAECVQLFEDHEALLRTGLGPQFPAVALAVASFDFTAALGVIDGSTGQTPP